MALTKQEYYETGTVSMTGGFGADVFGGQTFSPSAAHTITRVGVYASKQGSPSGDGFIDLYDCDQDTHKPTGPRLARATYATADVTGTSESPRWLEKDLDTGVELSQDHEYSLVFSQPDSVPPTYILFRGDTSGTYAGGMVILTTDGGTNWTVYDTQDYQFREYSLDAPAVTTGLINEILSTTATAWGDITSLGNAAVTQHGHCWGASANPTTADTKTTKGTGSLGLFHSLVTGLSVNTTYHIRAYATNSFGTSYGADVTFATPSTGTPVVTTEICTDIAATIATGNGTIASIGSSGVTQHGHCWDTSPSPTTSLGTKTTNGEGFYGAFTSAITGLTVGTTYYIRAYATNTQGTAYGNNIILVAGGVSSEASGVISVVRERLHYVSASGIEYYIWGEPV